MLNDSYSQMTDMVVLFYSSDNCQLCLDIWEILDKSIALFFKHGSKKLIVGAINMDLNELTYLEIKGSLPYFYPVLRYYHSRSRQVKDYEDIGKLEVTSLIEFLYQMYNRFKTNR